MQENLMQDNKLLLIGGTSHVGKSTLGKRLADRLGWNYLSTDQLARHPGRPWRADERELPDDVVEHYANRSRDELVSEVLEHYRHNVWPIVHAIVLARLNNPYDLGLVLEGSAVLPEAVRAARYDRVRAVWLTARQDVVVERVRHSSRYEERSKEEQRLIDAFLERSICIDQVLMTSTAANGQRTLDTSAADPAKLTSSLLQGLVRDLGR